MEELRAPPESSSPTNTGRRNTLSPEAAMLVWNSFFLRRQEGLFSCPKDL